MFQLGLLQFLNLVIGDITKSIRDEQLLRFSVILENQQN